MNDLLNLFLAFLKVGSFSFGGAYSLMPIIENEIVKNHQWISNDEFLKVLGMVEIVPGAISIKFATYTGYKVAGIPGAIVANIGNLLTPAVLILFVSYFYNLFEKNTYVTKSFEGIKFAIIGMILAIMLKYIQTQYNSWKDIIFIATGFITAYFFKLNPVIIIAISIILALIIL